MLRTGIYPASVTPLRSDGRLDAESLAKLLAWFEFCGCRGVVLAGTNGEGPSLSAPEKRDLLATARPLAGSLSLILGIATPSLDEALWLAKQAGRLGAAAALVMPPGYFRSVSEAAIGRWFEALMDDSPIPIIAYNHPAMTGISLSPSLLSHLADHPQLAGVKDSSGFADNLVPFREALPDHVRLYVGDETLLTDALASGWSGSISGAANVLADWLVRIESDFREGGRESAEAKHALIRPVLEAIRTSPQPACHKGVLVKAGILASDTLRLPLESAPESAETLHRMLVQTVGERR
ncbi:MAG: dihydrodipicolinate synthase family protein [Fimbriimonadaceae bacterium]|nr:dihydrodipicolinate synthase family protein [Fimbriimonadaceae bacterium]